MRLKKITCGEQDDVYSLLLLKRTTFFYDFYFLLFVVVAFVRSWRKEGSRWMMNDDDDVGYTTMTTTMNQRRQTIATPTDPTTTDGRTDRRRQRFNISISRPVLSLAGLAKTVRVDANFTTPTMIVGSSRSRFPGRGASKAKRVDEQEGTLAPGTPSKLRTPPEERKVTFFTNKQTDTRQPQQYLIYSGPALR